MPATTAGTHLRILALVCALLLSVLAARAAMNTTTPPSRITIQHTGQSTRIEIRQPLIWLYILPNVAAVVLCAYLFVIVLIDMFHGLSLSLGGFATLLISLALLLAFTYSLLSLCAGSDVIVIERGRFETSFEILGRRILIPETYTSPVKEVRVTDSKARSESGGFKQVEIDFEDGSARWISSFLDKAEADRVAGAIRDAAKRS